MPRNKPAEKTPKKKQEAPFDYEHYNFEIKHNLKLTKKQKEIIKVAREPETKMIILDGLSGTGKAQPLDAKIATPFGWKTMGEIKVNDYVFSQDGLPTKVLGEFPQGSKDIYRVTFSDGSSTECCEEHLWFTQTSKDRCYQKRVPGKRSESLYYKCPRIGSVKTLREIKESILTKYLELNHSIPLTKPVEFEEVQHLISPYLMGLLLGDGGLTHYVGFSTVDNEILESFQNGIDNNYKIRKNGDCDYIIARKKGKGVYCPNIYKNEIERLELLGKKSNKKFIPSEYMFDSVRNRESLLQGLMDSDGTVDKIRGGKSGGSISLSTCSDQLRDGMKELVESLGGVVKISKKKPFYKKNGIKIYGQDSYVLTVSVTSDIQPFRLSRKLNIYVPKTKYPPMRYIKSVELSGEKDCKCILVENESHLYLTDNYIVTHNTLLSMLIALEKLRDKRVGGITAFRSTVQSKDGETGFLPGEWETGKGMFLGGPFYQKMNELLKKTDADIIGTKFFDFLPTSFIRSYSFENECLMVCESQNLYEESLYLCSTRAGEGSFVVLEGDTNYQNDIGKKSGFKKFCETFNDEESRRHGIYYFYFDESDIVRSGLVKYIIQKRLGLERK